MISLAMIVKDEFNTLEETVNSVKDYVDEIVIGIDEASSDGTAEVARKLATRTLPIFLSEELALQSPSSKSSNPKEFGFAAARNRVLNKCNIINWRLILDGHELLHNPEKMKEAVEKAILARADCVKIPVHFEKDSRGISQLEYGSIRIIAPEVLYVKAEHNYPVVKKTYVTKDIFVEHCKTKQDPKAREARNKQRSAANVAGFKEALRINPKDVRSWFYLATAYKENASWQEAIDAFESYLGLSVWREERWHARIGIAVCQERLGLVDKARDQYSLALEEFPRMAEAYYYLGNLAYKQKRYREAQTWFEKCIQFDMPEVDLFKTPGIYLADRYDTLSMVYNHFGWWGKAIDMAKRALANINSPRIENNIKHWKNWIAKHDKEYYDKIWAKHGGPSALEIQRLQKIIELLGDAVKVLDVGSGPGWLCDYLKKDMKYVGLDISEVAREKVKAKGQEAVGSFEELGISIFDGCVLGEVLEHIEDDVEFIKKLKKYLGQGATVVVSVPSFGVMQDPAHVRDYTAVEMKSLLSILGSCTDSSTIGPWTIYKCTVG